MSEDSSNERVFRFLKGKWSVCRRFEGGYRGTFSGKAELVPEAGEPSSLVYREAGELTDDTGQQFAAKQSYLYRLAGGRLQVLKREGADWEMMHELDFEWSGDSAKATHVHLCGRDDYDALYRVDLAGNWELSYRVEGPKKDYRIHSHYTRIPDRTAENGRNFSEAR